MQQKIKLTIEEILRMTSNFVHKLQELPEKDKEKIKSISSMDLQEILLSFGFKEVPKPKIHYACTLGFMEIFIGKEVYPIKALVYTSAELNIIPEEIAIKASLTTINLNMNLREIGGHTTSLVALSEFTLIILASGEETQIHFFLAKGSVHTVLGIPFLEDNNITLEFSYKQCEILSYQEPDGRRLCMPICKPQEIGWKTGPPRGMDLYNMEKLFINTPGNKSQKKKRENTIINLTQKTQGLSISPKSDNFDESPSIVYKPIDNKEENFQILVDGNDKINGNPFKTKPKSEKVRFSKHHELSDEEIINEIEKDLSIMEERDKKVKDTYHINFLGRPLNSQEEPYEWQLEKPEFIWQTTNEEDETETVRFVYEPDDNITINQQYYDCSYEI
ncbi:hypothetical protein O181_088974 [Austropuccinia psidii MF-1]|uniref:Uncharacterized protein n=1 Tax=Austropuccinia psidii MF-1 TaxID=1389203 RepID=A0A9Q3P4M6_9BASI|nr:hypothetical protein [Austropuccinia psidii MF-1]